MKKTSTQQRLKSITAAAAACILIVSSGAVAYATNLGGIQRTLQLWIHGDQTEVTIQFNGEGSYTMDYLDQDGNPVHQGGGGVAIEEDGTEVPLTEAELMEHLIAPTVRYEEDGSVWIDWLQQQTEITHQFQENICYVQLINGEDVLYMTVEYKNGFSTSPNKFLDPSSSK